MKRNTYLAIIFIAIVIIGGILYAHFNKANAPTITQKSINATTFTIHATDDGADITTINVKKGDTIHITFAVSDTGVYHGGLNFKSDVVTTGAITPGSSKTVSFTTDKSFIFTPFWATTDIQKDYLIHIEAH